MKRLRVLHLSDLHFTEDAAPEVWLQPLVTDLAGPRRDGGLKVARLDHIVVSGDLTDSATEKQFECAFKFLELLAERFQVPRDRCLVVPGNHDLSWEVEVYEQKAEGDTSSVGYLVRTPEYPKRFGNFASALGKFRNRDYSLEPSEQFDIQYSEDESLLLLGLNSAFEIDRYYKTRSGICQRAMVHGIDAVELRLSKTSRKPLKIAVWHHPVEGNEKIIDTDFLQNLETHGFYVILHGHVHETEARSGGYLRPHHRHTIGAGAFGAYSRPESTPYLYHLLEIVPSRGWIRVYARSRKSAGGAWGGFAVGAAKADYKRPTYFDIWAFGKPEARMLPILGLALVVVVSALWLIFGFGRGSEASGSSCDAAGSSAVPMHALSTASEGGATAMGSGAVVESKRAGNRQTLMRPLSATPVTAASSSPTPPDRMSHNTCRALCAEILPPVHARCKVGDDSCSILLKTQRNNRRLAESWRTKLNEQCPCQAQIKYRDDIPPAASGALPKVSVSQTPTPDD